MVVLGTPPDRVTPLARAPSTLADRARRSPSGSRAGRHDRGVAVGQWLRGLDVVPRGHPGDGRVEVQVYGLRRARTRGRCVTASPPATHVPHPRIRDAHRPRGRDRARIRQSPLEVDGARPAATASRRSRRAARGLPTARVRQKRRRDPSASSRRRARRYHRHPHAVRTGDLHRGRKPPRCGPTSRTSTVPCSRSRTCPKS